MVLSALGMMTLLLTALSTYVVAESMSKARLREMGIRAALGATGAQLGTIVLAETTRLVVAGLLVGLALSWLGANTIRVFLFQVAPLDPVTVGVAVTIILSVGLLVSTRPALRAASVDLASVLKEQ
jgi:ABC-type antimicrobial peptide transport system permease subunit